MILIAPSILACDFARLGEEVESVVAADADWLHMDVMDGHFVPNLTIGPDIVAAVRELTDDMVLDVHLMIERPLEYIDQFSESGADIITFHPEAMDPVEEVIEKIRSVGAEVGLAIKPGTPVDDIREYLEEVDMVLVMTVEPGFGGQSFMADQMPKVKELHELLGPEKYVQVDGGISTTNAKTVAAAGANVLVSGTGIFGKENRKEEISLMRRYAEEVYPAVEEPSASPDEPGETETEEEEESMTSAEE